MRGKAETVCRPACQQGITPAYAGKSHYVFSKSIQRQGSPPPMRGKENMCCMRGVFDRITPAYAGKRQKWRVHLEAWRDHPRLCGEKQRRLQMCNAKLGSPPPMRGKVLRATLGAPLSRITPAYAGKSFFLFSF